MMETREMVEKFLTLKKVMGNILRKVELGDGIGVTEISILLRVSEEKDVTLTRLSELTGYSNSLITFAVDSLEAKGLVKRVKGKDRRIFYVEITDEGRKRCKEIKEKINEKMTEILSSLSGEEMKELLSGIERLIFILQKVDSSRRG